MYNICLCNFYLVIQKIIFKKYKKNVSKEWRSMQLDMGALGQMEEAALPLSCGSPSRVQLAIRAINSEHCVCLKQTVFPRVSRSQLVGQPGQCSVQPGLS